MRLKPAWEVCREVGFRAQSLFFDNSLVGGGGFSLEGRGGLTILGGFLGWRGFIPVWGC